MKSFKEKEKFIRLRAEGKSLTAAAKVLGVAPSTCMKWDKAFKDEITALKAIELDTLYQEYYMTKERRIKAFGETLKRIDTALEEQDFELIAPEKLIELKIKYMQLLKDEYITLRTGLKGTPTREEIAGEMIETLNRFRAGEITQGQARQEIEILKAIREDGEDEGNTFVKEWIAAVFGAEDEEDKTDNLDDNFDDN